MNRYIDADVLIEECNNVIEEVDAGEVKEDYYDGYEAGVENIRDYAEHMPTIDAVRHGKWMRTEDECGDFLCWTCSECGEQYVMPHHRASYCPNCGADMRGAE